MSKFNFLLLTDEVRKYMLDEVKNDINENKLFLSPRLTEEGCIQYPEFIQTCIEKGNEIELHEFLNKSIYIKTQEFRLGKVVKVPSNAAQLIAQCEFNRYYIRGVCVMASKTGIELLEVYRARESSSPRPNSESKIGLKINAKLLLDDLRQNIGMETKIMPEINSGLSVKI